MDHVRSFGIVLIVSFLFVTLSNAEEPLWVVRYDNASRAAARMSVIEKGYEIVRDYREGSCLICRQKSMPGVAAAFALASSPALTLNDPGIAEIENRLERIGLPEQEAAGIVNSAFFVATTELAGISLLKWGLPMIERPPDSNEEDTSRTCTVAVLDTGVDFDHEGLKEHMWINPAEGEMRDGADDDGNNFVDDIYGLDFTQADPAGYVLPVGEPIDDNGHGTHVSGIVVSVSPQARIMGLKVLNAQGNFNSHFAAVQAIDYARKNGAKVINLSWIVLRDKNDPPPKRPSPSSLEHAINRAVADDILIVAAAGNADMDFDKRWQQPAALRLPSLISVMAVGPKGKKAHYSNHGSKNVDIAAPGGAGEGVRDHDVVSMFPGNQYLFSNGTSMAAPHVTGVAAAIRARFPELKAVEVKRVLLHTAVPSIELKGYCRCGGVVSYSRAMAFAENWKQISKDRRFGVIYQSGRRGDAKDAVVRIGAVVDQSYRDGNLLLCRLPPDVQRADVDTIIKLEDNESVIEVEAHEAISSRTP